MANMTGWKSELVGVYLSWNSARWLLSGHKASMVSTAGIYNERKGLSIIFPTVSFDLAVQTCSKFGGDLWTPVDRKSHQ